MKKYIGTKVLKAIPMTRGEYNRYRGWDMPSNEDPADDGYLVEYEDGGKPNDARHTGYISWSPADVFERSYQPTQGMMDEQGRDTIISVLNKINDSLSGILGELAEIKDSSIDNNISLETISDSLKEIKDSSDMIHGSLKSLDDNGIEVYVK